MKSIARFRLLVLAAALGFIVQSASAVSVTYSVEYLSTFAEFGSGMMTLSDTPDIMSGDLDIYRFTSVMGTGGRGDWVSALFRYNPTTGFGEFRTQADAFVQFGGSLMMGATGIEAFEAFDDGVSGSFVSISRKPTQPPMGVPEGGSTLLLLGMVAAGYAVRRRKCPVGSGVPVPGSDHRVPVPGSDHRKLLSVW